MCLLAFILYVSVCIPLRVGFSLPVEPWNAWFIVDIVADLFFLVDMILNFRTGFFDDFGVLQSNGRRIVKNYVGWSTHQPFWDSYEETAVWPCCATKQLPSDNLPELQRIAERRGVDLTYEELLEYPEGERKDKVAGEIVEKLKSHKSWCRKRCGGGVCGGLAAWTTNLMMCPVRGEILSNNLKAVTQPLNASFPQPEVYCFRGQAGFSLMPSVASR